MQTTTLRSALFGIIGGALCGCAGVAVQDPPPPPVNLELKAPTIAAVAPTQFAVGDRVQVFGSNFIDTQTGTLRIHLSGTFIETDTEKKDAFAGDFPLTYVNPGLATFEFGPNVVFAEHGDQIGHFTGAAQVILTSIATSKDQPSDNLSVDLQVQPSVIVDFLHSVDPGINCEPVTSATIESTNLAFGFRSVGLGDASDSDPITVKIQFSTPAVTAWFIKDGWTSVWPVPNPSVKNTIAGGGGIASISTDIVTGHSIYIDPLTRPQSFHVEPPVQLDGQSPDSTAKLFQLVTGAAGDQGQTTVPFIIEASRKSGVTARRSATLQIFRQAQIAPYDGNSRVVELYQAQSVSGCFPGGDTMGLDLTYTEGRSESRSRTLDFKWDMSRAQQVGASVGGDIGLPNIFSVNASGSTQVTYSQAFGIDVSATVTSDHHVDNTLSAHILPGYYAMFYRQTQRIERTVDLVYHNACGVSGVVGKAVLTDWNWSGDIASGSSCPPPTKLPAPFRID